MKHKDTIQALGKLTNIVKSFYYNFMDLFAEERRHEDFFRASSRIHMRVSPTDPDLRMAAVGGTHAEGLAVATVRLFAAGRQRSGAEARIRPFFTREDAIQYCTPAQSTLVEVFHSVLHWRLPKQLGLRSRYPAKVKLIVMQWNCRRFQMLCGLHLSSAAKRTMEQRANTALLQYALSDEDFKLLTGGADAVNAAVMAFLKLPTRAELEKQTYATTNNVQRKTSAAPPAACDY